MAELLGNLIGAGSMLVIGVGLITAIFLTYWLPVMAFRAMRDLRKIREQFERLNDILERQQSYPVASKPNGRDQHVDVSGPTYTTRTGPLGRL
jgi:hypothetical protein